MPGAFGWLNLGMLIVGNVGNVKGGTVCVGKVTGGAVGIVLAGPDEDGGGVVPSTTTRGAAAPVEGLDVTG